jgi:CubicO group peptidase (beta-lactamase class C family)
MRNLPSLLALQKITQSAHVPAVGYAYVEQKGEGKHEFSGTTLTIGKKNAQSTDVIMNKVDRNTRFPASSLSKIVFTYLVLQLVKAKHITLDEPLHSILQYERFSANGQYPKKAERLTARHVLSHTTGLPNFGSNLASNLTFDPTSELGEGYSYSGEAFLYLQKVIEKKMGEDLETLAQRYVFGPDALGMDRSTFLPQPKNDTNSVAVHTELGKPTAIYEVQPHLNAAGSLLTTAHDFSKFMMAWLEQMNDPIFQQAFKPTSAEDFPTCGLGWHLYRKAGEVIAYQFGENPNTRSFVAINLNTQKATAFFTNSENGMSIANQLLNSPDFPTIGDLQAVFKHLHYQQSDEPGWCETLEGKIAEDQGEFDVARLCFKKALELAPDDASKQRRLTWFNAAHHPAREKQAFPQPLESFIGKLTNRYNDEVAIAISANGLIYKEFDREIKLVRISNSDFVPEKDQSFKIRFNGNHVSIRYDHGAKKALFFRNTAEEIARLRGITETPGISYAAVSHGKLSEVIAQGKTDIRLTADDITEHTVFEAASLSKPVFAYLVLKLAERYGFDLDQDLVKILPHERRSSDEHPEKISARMILSHQAGFPGMDWGNAREFAFRKPGEVYEYSGTAYYYLQKVIEEKYSPWKLEQLAEQLVFRPLQMDNTSFLQLSRFNTALGHTVDNEPVTADKSSILASAPNSLRTTGHDFGLFIAAWMQEKGLLLEAFTPSIWMMSDGIIRDTWAHDTGVVEADLQKIAWGLGFGLQTTDEGIIAFHWGDCGESRSFVAMNLTTQRGVVYLTNSHNGLSMARDLVTPVVGDVTPTFNYLFKKYGFEHHDTPDWKKRQYLGTWHHFAEYAIPDKARWLSDACQKKLLDITMNENACTLTITYHSKELGLFAKIIANEMNVFKSGHHRADSEFKIDKEEQGEFSTLVITISNPGLYHQFIQMLKTEDLLPTLDDRQERQELGLSNNGSTRSLK